MTMNQWNSRSLKSQTSQGKASPKLTPHILISSRSLAKDHSGRSVYEVGTLFKEVMQTNAKEQSCIVMYCKYVHVYLLMHVSVC